MLKKFVFVDNIRNIINGYLWITGMSIFLYPYVNGADTILLVLFDITLLVLSRDVKKICIRE